MQQILVGGEQAATHRLLVGDTIPDSIAGEYEEAVVVVYLGDGDVRLGGDDLRLAGQVRELLVLEIAQRAGQVQVAVDAPHHADEAARAGDALHLPLLLQQSAD